MKVTEVKTIVVANEAPYIGGRYLLFIELHTDEGIVGLGERVTGAGIGLGTNFPTEDMRSQIYLIEEIGRQYIVGQNPFRGSQCIVIHNKELT